jgi:predicted DNA-binding transcriptional regulator AlpA
MHAQLEDRFLRIPTILQILGISRATLYRFCKEKAGFPKIQKLIQGSGSRCAAGLWASTLNGWMESQKQKETTPQVD